MLQASDFEGAIHSLRAAGLRPTFPRITVAMLLLERGSGATMDDLMDEVRDHSLPLAPPDVEGALSELRAVGLVAKLD